MTDPVACKLCGGPLRADNRSGVCSRAECANTARREAARLAREADAGRGRCQLCGRVLRNDSKFGICKQTRECRNAGKRAGYADGLTEAGRLRLEQPGEARTAAWQALLARLAEDLNLLEARRQAEREAEREAGRARRREAWCRGVEAARANRAAEAAVPLTELEAELARRLSNPCPVCGKPVGGNTGRCWRSPRCIDAAIRAYRPGFNLGPDVCAERAMQDTG